MSFKEIKPPTKFIRIKESGKVTISASLINVFVILHLNKLKKCRLFHDEKNKIIGLKPDTEGYKITLNAGCYSIKSAFLARIITGEFFPKWSKKQKMYVFEY